MTIKPLESAAPLSVTVPEALFPPMRLVGVTVTADSAGRLIVRLALSETASYLAVTVVDSGSSNAVVSIEKVAFRAPLGIDTDMGNLTPNSGQLKRTTAPAVGASPFRPTVPVDEPPSVTFEGFSESVVNSATVILSDPLTDVPPADALTLAAVVALTPVVLAVNETDELPAATLTLAGTWRADDADASWTTNPPVGAGESREATPVASFPQTTELGLKVRDFSFAPSIVSLTAAALEPSVPVIFTVVLVRTGEVLIEKEAVVAPFRTFTVAGTVAAALDDSRETVTPPKPAFFESVILPVDVSPPLTEAGDTASLAIV